MKVWMVLYIMGKIAAAWGPVELSVADCNKGINQYFNHHLVTGINTKIVCKEFESPPTLEVFLSEPHIIQLQ